MSFFIRSITKIFGAAALAALLPLSAMADEPVYQFRMHEMGVEQPPSNEDIWVKFLADHGMERLLYRDPSGKVMNWGYMSLVFPRGIGSANITELPNVPFPANSIGYVTLNGSAVKNVDGFISIEHAIAIDLKNNQLQNISGFSNMDVETDVHFQNNNLTSVDGLSGLQGTVRNLYLQNNKIKNLDGLKGITQISYDAYFQDNKIEDISGLSNLQYVDNMFLANNNLHTLDGLSNLRTINFGMDFKNNPNLVDLSGLRNVKNLNLSFITFDAGIQNRPGFVPIQGGALCDSNNTDKFPEGYAQQSDVCASVH